VGCRRGIYPFDKAQGRQQRENQKRKEGRGEEKKSSK